MTHRALQVIDALSTSLAEQPDLAASVMAHRVLSLSEDDQELPAVCPRIGADEPLSDRGVTNLGFIDSQLTVNVALYARASSEPELIAELMRLRACVHRGVMLNQTFGLSFVVGSLYLGAAEPEIDSAGSMLAGRLDASFAVEYRMNVTDPE